MLHLVLGMQVGMLSALAVDFNRRVLTQRLLSNPSQSSSQTVKWQRLPLCRMMTSAAAMQSAWRSHKARQRVQAIRREDAAVVLQSHWRRRAAVKSYRAAIMCAPPCDDLWLLPRCASGTLILALRSSVSVGSSTGIAVTFELVSNERLRHDRSAPRC